MQWQPVTADGTAGPNIMMLTTDLAMKEDPAYLPYAEMYAANGTQLNVDFASAWYHLTSADMGPATRCIGDLVPEPQSFQYTLPASPETLPDYIPVRAAIETSLDSDEKTSGHIALALNCASTYRATDYRGGCNGAKIRFAPESEWESNAGLADYIGNLEGLKTSMSLADVSMADLIVLAGIAAVEKMSNLNLSLPFCGGYVDAEDAAGSEPLAPRIYATPYITITDDFLVKGLTMEEGVALASAQAVGSQWYQDLLATGGTSADFDEYELALLEGDLLPIVETFAEDEAALSEAFTSGWVHMMTADRYADNLNNACTGVSTPTLEGATPAPTPATTPAPEPGTTPAPEPGTTPAPAPDDTISGAATLGFAGLLGVAIAVLF